MWMRRVCEGRLSIGWWWRREVVWWALERVGVDGWLVGVIQSMYVRVTIAVGVVGEGSAEFWVGVGVRRGL